MERTHNQYNPNQTRRPSRLGRAAIALSILGSLFGPGVARGDAPANVQLVAEGVSSKNAEGTSLLKLNVGKSAVLTTKVPYKRVNVASPEIADVNPIGPSSVLVTAKKAGSTQVILWDDADHSQVIDVEVSYNLTELTSALQALIPGGKIEVSSGNGVLALRGSVPSLNHAEQAMTLAAPYGSKVLNFLEVSGGQQVMLSVRFAEVSRNATSQLGVNMGFNDGTAFGASTIGTVHPFFANNGLPQAGASSPGVTLFGGGQVGSTAITAFVSALSQNNLMRTLADPNLIAMSGQEASFLAGGEFPVPVPQNSGGGTGGTTITVEYREFGVRLKFVPIVLGDGRIRLKVTPEVSDLDFSSPIQVQGFTMPIINKRTVTTTIEMAEGQTFAVAGLLNNTSTANANSTPGLGDLPVIGALFRSVRYQRKETELVVLVTPHLVEAMNPNQVPQLPGERWRHPSENELFWMRDLGGPATDSRKAPKSSERSSAHAGYAPVSNANNTPRTAWEAQTTTNNKTVAIAAPQATTPAATNTETAAKTSQAPEEMTDEAADESVTENATATAKAPETSTPPAQSVAPAESTSPAPAKTESAAAPKDSAAPAPRRFQGPYGFQSESEASTRE